MKTSRQKYRNSLEMNVYGYNFCHNVFKRCPLQGRQKGSICEKGGFRKRVGEYLFLSKFVTPKGFFFVAGFDNIASIVLYITLNAFVCLLSNSCIEPLVHFLYFNILTFSHIH